MTVTVRIDDDGQITECVVPLPDIQALELRIATETQQPKMPLAWVFLRTCSLGLDVFLKEYGRQRANLLTQELKRMLD
jgi:hypothetical protein